MKNIWTICWRELKSYFGSPVPYVAGAASLALLGYLFSIILLGSREASLRHVFTNTVFLLAIFAPVLTMRLLAEEQRSGTIELLLTAPVHDWQIVVGKYLGSLITYVVFILVPTLYYVLILALFGEPDYGPIVSSYLGIFFLGASFLAVGLLTSALTQNQIIACFVGIVLLLFVWLADAGITTLGVTGALGDALNFIAIPRHLDDLFRGVVDTRDLMYVVRVIALSLFLATQLLQSRRWR